MGKSAVAQATPEEMAAEKLELAVRDSCAHILIPLNKCRKDTFYLPWKCGHLRHAYEICQHDDFVRRQKQLREERQSKA